MASEMDQVHAFVHEMGEEVEVQWGISIDNKLEDKVRVTVIATGYEVSDIPGLDDAVGKKTVEEAIDSFYKDTKEKEQAKEEQNKPSAPEPMVLQEGDIVIDLDEENPVSTTRFEQQRSIFTPPQETKTETKSTGLSGIAGWMRGRR